MTELYLLSRVLRLNKLLGEQLTYNIEYIYNKNGFRNQEQKPMKNDNVSEEIDTEIRAILKALGKD